MAYLQTNDEKQAKQKAFLRGLEQHRDVRRPYEADWEKVARYCDPRRVMAFGDTARDMAGQTQGQRVYTSLGVLKSQRCAAQVGAYAIDYVKPFLEANAERDLFMKGQVGRLGQPEREFLARMKWQLFYMQMRPGSNFVSSNSLAFQDYITYGVGITWIGLGEQRAIRWRHRDFRRAYIAQNAEGQTDTVWYEEDYPVWRVVALWPKAKEEKAFADKFVNTDGSLRNEKERVTVIFAVEPRNGPDIKIGAVAQNKPFKYLVALPNYGGAILEEGGYDSFPYQVGARKSRDGNPYGQGIGIEALPELVTLDFYQRGLETNLDLINNPVLVTPEGLFDELAFTPGKVNTFDLNQLGFADIKNSVSRLSIEGNVSPVSAYMQILEERIHRHFFGDALELRQNGNMTATEVTARTDLNLRSLANLVTGLDRDFLGNGADRVTALMVQNNMLGPLPENLVDAVVEWDYQGPLATAMRANQVDGLARLLSMWQMVAAVDPAKADVFDIDMIIRNWADGQGIEPDNLVAAEVLEQLRLQRQQQEAAQAQTEQMMAEASALRDGAQGVASLANMGGDDVRRAA